MSLQEGQEDVELQVNILLLGPTGTGKTRSDTCSFLEVPFAGPTDATTLTEAGYVGEDVENILLQTHHCCRWR